MKRLAAFLGGQKSEKQLKLKKFSSQQPRKKKEEKN